MRARRLALLVVPALLGALTLAPPGSASAASAGAGVGVVPQGPQSDAAFAVSGAAAHVTNTVPTETAVSCYRPEVPWAANYGPNDGYSGESACPGATTGEDTGAAGPYATQAGSNPGYPAAGPMLVKDHSESDIRVDPTDPNHIIGSSKWVVSAEGYNHLLGFYESFDGGKSWPVSGHIPGYEGWTDNTDPVGAFDSYGDYYELMLPYQFTYKADGSHDYTVGTSQEANQGVPAEVISVSVRPHGSTKASQWVTTRNGRPDYIATYDSIGNGPDKQWIAIDTNPASPHFNRIYAMWVDFHHNVPVPFVSYADALPGGAHTDWSKPEALPEPPSTPQGATYLLPHVAPDGSVWTSITNFDPAHRAYGATMFVDSSGDGGATWSTAGTAETGVVTPGATYANTTFRSGIENTFTTGTVAANGHYPLYLSYEDDSTGVDNVMLTASYDGGATWSSPIQVNDNATPVDEFQPNLATAADGTISVAFYDRRLACPAAGSTEATAAGLALDRANPNYTGALPPYGASNYCANTAIQFYNAALTPLGSNIRLSAHSFDPQLNSPSESATGNPTFLGDYFGNTVGQTAAGAVDWTTSVTTYDDGGNPANRQQQLVASIPVP